MKRLYSRDKRRTITGLRIKYLHYRLLWKLEVIVSSFQVGAFGPGYLPKLRSNGTKVVTVPGTSE